MNKKILYVLMVIIMLSLSVLAGCQEPDQSDNPPDKDLVIDIMSEEYGAKGDGVTNDRAVIQKAIDDASAAGGGTVYFRDGHTFLTGNVILGSNVTLKLGVGTTIQQSNNPNDYIEARGYDYGDGICNNSGYIEKGEPWKPLVGVQQLPYDERVWPESTGFWRECWNWNYPLIYADKGTCNVRILGTENSTIRSTTYTGSNTIYMLLIGFYRVDNFIISGLELIHEHSHCYNFNNCTDGLINEVKNWTPASTVETHEGAASVCDGLKLVNCQDIKVVNCFFAGGDDSFMIMSSFNDTRYDRWGSSQDVMPVRNIEVAYCTSPSYFKGLGFCGLGMMCEDRSLVEFSDIYIHDNNFCSVGLWEGFGWINLPDDHQPNYAHYNPIKNIRWENNNFEYWLDEYVHPEATAGLQAGMQAWPVSDQISDDPRLHSMTELRNANFETTGLAYWVDRKVGDTIAECRKDGDNTVGYLGDLHNGSAKLYEGLYLEAGTYKLTVKVKTQGGAVANLFVTDQSDTLIASKSSTATAWTTVELTFTLTELTNYRLGVEGAISGSVMFDDMTLQRI